jgi:hypothetical protein
VKILLGIRTQRGNDKSSNSTDVTFHIRMTVEVPRILIPDCSPHIYIAFNIPPYKPTHSSVLSVLSTLNTDIICMAPTSDTAAPGVTAADNIVLAGDSILPQLCRGVWRMFGGHRAGQDGRCPLASEPSLHQLWTPVTSGPDDVSDEEGVKARIGVMLVIFVVSLFGA